MLNKTLLILSIVLIISCNNEKDEKLYDQKYVDSVIAAQTGNNNDLNNKKEFTTDTQNIKYTPKSLGEIAQEAYEEVQRSSKIRDENLANNEYVRDIYKKGDEIFIKQYNDDVGSTYFINKHIEFNCIYGNFYLIPALSGFTDQSGSPYIDIMIEVEKSVDIMKLKGSDCAVWFNLTNGKKINYTDGFLSDIEINYLSKYKIKSLLIYDKTTNGVMVSAENLNTDYFTSVLKR